MSSLFFKAREYLTPTLRTSAFLDRGVLTPEEFVRAGDELVFKCPTWSWGGVHPKHAKRGLPPEKQYLITRNVPCSMRVESLGQTYETEVETPTESGGSGENLDDGESWLVSHISAPPTSTAEQTNSLEDEFDVLGIDGEIESPTPAPDTPTDVNPEPTSTTASSTNGYDDDDEYADIEDYEEDNDLLEDQDCATFDPQSNTSSTNNQNQNNPKNNNNILQTRTYDISITYDGYYQTPRVWIFGYKEDGMTPLTPDEMFQDVMSDYVKRTVTIETHPHIQGAHASIHPCQHGAVMTNIVRNMMGGSVVEGENGEENVNVPSVEMYLFIFLKFVSSIIPTINYDFTMEVSADTRRA